VSDRRAPQTAEPPPPLFGSWRNLYLLLILELAGLSILFYALTRWASQ
jgi:hypothetical protein